MLEEDNQRALVYILQDELFCLRADMFAAAKDGKYQTAAELTGLIQEIHRTITALLKEDDVSH